jgi:hypothetical protein
MILACMYFALQIQGRDQISLDFIDWNHEGV